MLGYRDTIHQPFDSSMRMAHFLSETPGNACDDAKTNAALEEVDRDLMSEPASQHEVALWGVAPNIFSSTVKELCDEREPKSKGRRQAERSGKDV